MRAIFTLIGAITFAASTQAANFTLAAENTEPLYKTTLTKTVYQHSHRDGLKDLSITNANGEPVPYALLPYKEVHRQTEITKKSQPLAIFPMQESTKDQASALNIQLNNHENNTSVNVSSENIKSAAKAFYLFDLGKKHPAFKKITLDWQAQNGELLTVKVMTSNDLNDWSQAGLGALLKVSADDQTMIQNSITMDRPIAARYLRIQPLEATATFKLTSATIEFNQTKSLAQPTLWQALPFTERAQEDNVVHIDFESPSRLPATALNINLPQINTITQVVVSSRNHQDQPWRRMTKASLYRLNKQGKNYTNQNIPLRATSARYWRLSFNQSKGGIGQENPQLSLGWLPDIVVWNARGAGPFDLQVGNQNSAVNAVPITNLITPYEAQKVRQLPKATIRSAGQTPATNAWDTPKSYTRFWLWGGLFLGVFALAVMAYSLLKNTSKT